MRWLSRQRASEGVADSMAASGAWPGSYRDPIDGDLGFHYAGQARREVPETTRKRTRAGSVHAYRMNPMAKAIIDTYTAFCVGDTGVVLTCNSPDVRPVAEDFWRDPYNDLPRRQELLLRSHMLEGETALEVMQGPSTGVVRYAYVEPDAIKGVRGLALDPTDLVFTVGSTEQSLSVVRIDDVTELRDGEVLFWPEWRAVASDTRGFPFLAPVLDWLDAYDNVVYDLADRTRIARFLTWELVVDGDQEDIDRIVKERGGVLHPPQQGTVDVHNKKLEWKAQMPQVGAYEDKQTASLMLTNIAAGVSLARTYLADPEDANRATSITMAEPVRRRLGGVQNLWVGHMLELVRFAIDRAVAAGRLPDMVEVPAERGGTVLVRPSETVRLRGPSIATPDAKISADILVNFAQHLDTLVSQKYMSFEAAQVLTHKAWEDCMGVPYSAELDRDPDAIAEYIGNELDGDDSPLTKRLAAA